MLALNKSIRFCLIVMSSAVITACSSLSAGNLFSHYTAQNKSVYQAVQAGDYVTAQEKLPDYRAGDILDNMEKGRVNFLAATYPASKASFELSDKAVREWQDQAVISVGDTATSVGALAVNDNITNYEPADYELGFLHLYLGLNYIQVNSLEGALVEMRRANQVQERAKRQRESELKSAEADMKKSGLSPNLGSVLSRYPDAGDKLKAVQNGYLLYLSALLYETQGDPNNAYVDYRRALAVAPDNRQVIDGALRVATLLGMRQDLELLTKQYGPYQSLPKGEGRVIILDERGVVKAMDDWRITIPVKDSRGDVGFYSVALPYYNNNAGQRFGALQLDGKGIDGDELVDVNLMASNQLTEQMPSILLRQVLRTVTKDRLRKEAANGDDVTNVLFNVFNTLTEQPDTRSWQSLPAEVYSSGATLEVGSHELVVSGTRHEFSVREGETTLVWLSRQGSNVTIWHKQLGAIQ
ncbi:COG3014 family protein [Vibrio comitans]